MIKHNNAEKLVSVDWLFQHLESENLIIFDASWHMPAAARDAETEWRQKRIAGAEFFDFDRKICDRGQDLPHMMPNQDQFTDELQKLGLQQDSVVVVYDSLGMFSSPRAWWMLRAMGCHSVMLLDGGLPAWEAAGYPIECSQPNTVAAGDFVADYNPQMIVDAHQVLAALEDPNFAVIDARPTDRFNGAADEPRAGLRSGHMPGAVNLPIARLFNSDLFEGDLFASHPSNGISIGLLKPKADLRRIFAPLVTNKSQLIMSCGSGVTACMLAFAADYAGLDHFSIENIKLYDGSWCEWGLQGNLPVVSEVG